MPVRQVTTVGDDEAMILEALAALDRPGLAYLHFPWVFPLPPGVGDLLARASSLIAIEGNATGQFADLVEFGTGRRFDHRILRCDGSQYPVEELVERISALSGGGGKA